MEGLADDLTWAYNVTRLVEKVQQWLHFLKRLRKLCMSQGILRSFYRCIIQSILTNFITAWYGNSIATDHKRLQREVKTSERIIG